MRSSNYILTICVDWTVIEASPVPSLINTLQATDHFAENVNRGAFTAVVKDVVKQHRRS